MNGPVERYVDEAARTIGLPLAAAHRPGVIASFARLAEAAELVGALALPPDVEPAPRFAHDDE